MYSLDFYWTTSSVIMWVWVSILHRLLHLDPRMGLGYITSTMPLLPAVTCYQAAFGFGRSPCSCIVKVDSFYCFNALMCSSIMLHVPCRKSLFCITKLSFSASSVYHSCRCLRRACRDLHSLTSRVVIGWCCAALISGRLSGRGVLSLCFGWQFSVSSSQMCS